MSKHKRYSVVDEVFQLRKENATLRADNARLREVGKRLLNICYGIPHGEKLLVDEEVLIDRTIEEARQALAANEESEE